MLWTLDEKDGNLTFAPSQGYEGRGSLDSAPDWKMLNTDGQHTSTLVRSDTTTSLPAGRSDREAAHCDCSNARGDFVRLEDGTCKENARRKEGQASGLATARPCK